MKIYTVLSHENSDYRCGAEVRVFKTSEEAQAFMRRDYEGLLNDMGFDKSVQIEDVHSCEIGDGYAFVLDGINSWHWEVEEHDLDARVAVKVEGGMVQEATANAAISLDVYDMDISDFPDEEEVEADSKRDEYNKLSEAPGWMIIW